MGKNIILNVQIQILKIENRALKINDELSNVTTLDLDLVYGFRKPHDKSEIEFDKNHLCQILNLKRALH
jgi:hypothetical protein